ncbi:fumarylacetoacetate hydrolase family protein [Paenibacillus koleovorans]|uniref:fumarylacetoacetate hydrolase family protein n=1 Tax=Paenibacillus koleovorans TaxID=121608 RepID=UPI000FD6E524|nr:fumarylacetoacetate hydrolase family protein [Paenibacillus koleovorans]
MFQSIRNIYCIGRNYRAHAEELGNAVPDAPMLFGKPTHSLVAMDGGEVMLPGGRGDIHYEAEVVVRISRAYEPGMKVDELIDAYALGLDLTLRDVQSELKKKGHPWLAAKGFLHSAPITGFRPFPGAAALQAETFTLLKNEVVVQRGNTGSMIFDLQTIIDFTARHFGLGEGDILFTGTPEGVGAASDGDRLELKWGNESWGACTVRLSD